MNTGVDNTAAEEGDIVFLEAAQGATQGPLQTAQAEIIAGIYHSFWKYLYLFLKKFRLTLKNLQIILYNLINE